MTGTVIGEALGPKLVVFKFKQKVKYRRRTGHRQHLTRVRIDEIAASGMSTAQGGRHRGDGRAEGGEGGEGGEGASRRRERRPQPKAAAASADAADKPKRARKPAAAKPKAEAEE